MDTTTFILFLIAITLIIASIYLIIVMLEVRRTMRTVRFFITRVDTEVSPTLRELREVLTDLRVTTAGVASRVDDVKSAMTAIGDTGRNISRVNCALGEVADVVSRVSLLSTGIKAAGKYAVSRITQRRG